MTTPPPPFPTPPDAPVPAHWFPGVQRTGLIAAAFTVIVVGAMIWGYRQSVLGDPLSTPELAQLKAELIQRPNEEELKLRIRKLDAEARTRFFAQQQSTRRGIVLLLGGLVLALAALKLAGKLLEQPYDPRQRPPPNVWQLAAKARGGLALMGLALAGGLSMLAYAAKDVQVLREVAKAPDYPTPEEWARNWPIFRGPTGSGVAQSPHPPTQWDGKAGKGVLWKVAVALPGLNSPILWERRLFLSGATREKRAVFCFDPDDGKLLWEQEVRDAASAKAEPPKPMEDTGFAAPTLACDGRRVYACFANGDLAAFTVEGRPVWTKNLGRPENGYGHASSPTLWRDRLVVQFDQGTAGRSALLAFEGATGKLAWRTSRPAPASWCTPLVIQTEAREEIIAAGQPFVMGYDPVKGQELWRAKLLNGDVAPSPVFANGLVYACNVRSKLGAIKPGGTGDVTESRILWSTDEGSMPDTVSPLCAGELVLIVGENNTLACFDAQNGKLVWEHEYDFGFAASPTLCGKLLYLADKEGVTHVIEVGRQFKEVSACPLGEAVGASPVILNNRLYLRGKQHLFCIGSKE